MGSTWGVRVPRRAGGRHQVHRRSDHQDEESRRRTRPAFDRQGEGILNFSNHTKPQLAAITFTDWFQNKQFFVLMNFLNATGVSHLVMAWSVAVKEKMRIKDERIVTTIATASPCTDFCESGIIQ